MHGYVSATNFKNSTLILFQSMRNILTLFTRGLQMIYYFLFQGSSNSHAIKKKDELERVAKSNR